jgi:hypothetical protein
MIAERNTSNPALFSSRARNWVFVSWVSPSKSSVPMAIISADGISYSVLSERLYPYGKIIRSNDLMEQNGKIIIVGNLK